MDDWRIKLFVLSLGTDKLELLGGLYEGGLRLQQVPDEISSCISDLLKLNRKFNSYLEIGAAAGGTTFLLNHYFQFRNIVLIDNNAYLKKIGQPELRHKNLRGIEYTEIIGNSRGEQTYEKFCDLQMMFDLMLIDGDHRPVHIDRDVELYLPFLKRRGYVVFHDTVACRGVKSVFNQMKENKHFVFINEYVAKKHHRPCGIGVFQRR